MALKNKKEKTQKITEKEAVAIINKNTADFFANINIRTLAAEKIASQLDTILKKDASSPISIIKEKKFVIPETKEKYIAISGDVTSGKSTFLNAVCGYPICPSATTTTSICPVELRKASSKDNERIEICLVDKDGKNLSSKNGEYKSFTKQVFSPALFDKLRSFVDYLMKTKIIKVDSLMYFKELTDTYSFDIKNWHHTMVLLMILFDTYLHEDKTDNSKDYQTAYKMKKELFAGLGLNNFEDKSYGIRLYWCSDRIPDDSVIIDLPGTSSATEDNLHTKIVNSYLARVSSLMFLIDLTGNLSHEARATVNLFLKDARNKQRDTSELVSFIMNKADTIDEESLQSVIKAFRDNYPEYDKYSLYAVSSIRGEWLFIDSDIAPEKTFLASTYKKLRIPTTADMLKERLSEGYSIEKYPFSLNGSDLNYNTASLSDFMGEHIENYIRRLNFQGTLNLFDSYTKYLSNLCLNVSKNTDMLINASGISEELSKELTKALFKSLEEAEEKLIKDRLNFMRDIDKMNTEFSSQTECITESFSNSYKDYNKFTNLKIKAAIQRLEVKKGVIPIDGSFIGTNKEGIHNREVLTAFLKSQANDITEELISAGGSGKFTDSFNMLETEFARERKMYAGFLEKNINTLLAVPSYAETQMKEKFSKILSDNNVPAEYFSQTEKIISNVCNLLTISCEEFAEDLIKDTSFEKAISETSERMHDGLSIILQPYTKDEGSIYAANVISNISRSHFFKANSIDPLKLEDFLNTQYINDFSAKLENLISDVFEGSSEEGTDKSHSTRIMNAIADFYANISTVNMKKLSEEAKKACGLLENMDRSKELEKRFAVYREFAEYIKKAFSPTGHYKDTINLIWDIEDPTVKECARNFVALREKADSIINQISDFEKAGENNE